MPIINECVQWKKKLTNDELYKQMDHELLNLKHINPNLINPNKDTYHPYKDSLIHAIFWHMYNKSLIKKLSNDEMLTLINLQRRYHFGDNSHFESKIDLKKQDY